MPCHALQAARIIRARFPQSEQVRQDIDMHQPHHSDDSIDDVVQLMRRSESLLFITGAGMSAESGLPTYRGVGGLYDVDTTTEGVPIEEILSGAMLMNSPELTWKYLMQIADACGGATFNRGHAVLAEIEERFDRVWIVTQNVDGFHQAAGSKKVIDLHGDLHELTCTRCDYRNRLENDGHVQLELPPKCPDCQSPLRPDVVLFGEMLPTEKTDLMYAELSNGFDMVFSIGTSSVFRYISWPVEVAKQSGIPTVEINPGTSDVSHLVDIQLSLPAAQALDEIWGRFQSAD